MACVWGGLWSYAETGGLPLIPPWLIVIWACFPTALWLIVRSLLGEMPQARPGTLPLALAGIALQIALFLTLSENRLLVICAALLLAGAAFGARPEKSTVILLAAGAVLGPVCEALPVAAGAWAYARPDLMGMPAWLPLAYALFALLVAQAGLSLLRPPLATTCLSGTFACTPLTLMPVYPSHPPIASSSKNLFKKH